MLKREWGAESNGKLLQLFIPSKTATLVPEFAAEDLPLGRTSALMPEFAVKTCPCTDHSDDDDEYLQTTQYFQVAHDISKRFNTINNIAQSFNLTYKCLILLHNLKYCAILLTV